MVRVSPSLPELPGHHSGPSAPSLISLTLSSPPPSQGPLLKRLHSAQTTSFPGAPRFSGMEIEGERVPLPQLFLCRLEGSWESGKEGVTSLGTLEFKDNGKTLGSEVEE